VSKCSLCLSRGGRRLRSRVINDEAPAASPTQLSSETRSPGAASGHMFAPLPWLRRAAPFGLRAPAAAAWESPDTTLLRTTRSNYSSRPPRGCPVPSIISPSAPSKRPLGRPALRSAPSMSRRPSTGCPGLPPSPSETAHKLHLAFHPHLYP
jgi:hypothetical protein